jgi:hypothetical protein
MANPRAGFYNSGLCAASRAYRQIRKMAAMDIYMDESITGGGYNAIEFIQGVTEAQLKNAALVSDAQQATKGAIYYKGKLLIPILTDTEIKHDSVPLKEMPAGFDREKEFRISALHYAKATGLPPHDLDPALTARGAMGIGAQAQIIEENVAGYGEGDWEKQFLKAVNRLIVPSRSTFAFTVQDARDQAAWAGVTSTRIGNRSAAIASGELTVPQAQQMAVDAGDMPREFLTGPDVTEDEALSDEEKPSDVEGGEPKQPASVVAGVVLKQSDPIEALRREIRAAREDLRNARRG